MTKREKRRIVREMIAELELAMLRAVDHSPDEWDGRELRALMGDIAKEKYRNRLTGERLKSYENDRIILNV